jgi:cell division protein ZapA
MAEPAAMAQIEVTVNNRSYMVACDDGQEAHVARLGRYVDQKVQSLVKTVGQVGDARLLLMASLIVADELVDTNEALANAKSELAGAPEGRERAEPLAPQPPADEAVLARALDGLAQRIEAIAAELEQD